jgi:protein required for attachment to host cells
MTFSQTSPISLTSVKAASTHQGQSRFEDDEERSMKKISIPNGAWIMVADHSKAILFVNKGTPVVPQLEVRKVLEAPDNPSTHEQGADAPGTVYAGSHHSSVQQTDWHAIAGRRFLELAVEAVEIAKGREEFNALVLVAPPKALAELRNIISDAVRASIVGELDKDLVHLPVAKIAEHLAA